MTVNTIFFYYFSHNKNMSYFNYHAKAMSLIKANHCKKAQIIQKYNAISPALVLFFDNYHPVPIREHKWHVYFALLNEYKIPIETK